MLSAYPACFFKEESGYSVVFPDLNDLSTCGETLDESLRMAVDCLAGYLYWLKKDGEAAPARPRPWTRSALQTSPPSWKCRWTARS